MIIRTLTGCEATINPKSTGDSFTLNIQTEVTVCRGATGSNDRQTTYPPSSNSQRTSYADQTQQRT